MNLWVYYLRIDSCSPRHSRSADAFRDSDAVTIRYLSLSGPSNLRVLAAAFARACTQGEDKYDTDPTAARDGMLGVKAFNIDLPGLSKTELILAALGEEDITKLL
ncbi:hypothetical protein MCOR01_006072 [Pyricularia oryzae]|nr:hypothetical protein MCOR01_006072 [Pyricularia oryzae]